MVMPWPLPDESWFRPDPQPPAPGGDDAWLAGEIAYRIVGGVGPRARGVSVTVQNRVAILTGTVRDPSTRRLAGELAWLVPGVADVCNSLRVRVR
ncbi:BON domain-containing protein [Micromonospora halophytica]|uniref:BON domain-containing protein n=1 Tax=Micromonospora halophytica TaxID=47864 RepID=A0A1C5HJ60_9ACTN|nr:BON domain-containing protein [Micromonospora halophytica]SCG46025.1 BON domain-containing protein [Micromonospora halophytica]